ncbi:MAG: ATP-dependent RNA helicase HrpA, partial [Planctomycetota bacterium]
MIDGLRRQLDDCLPEDRLELQRRLHQLAGRLRRQQPHDRMQSGIEERLRHSQEALRARRAHAPRLEYPDELPISERREELLRALREHRVLVVTGETGSGKSTQLPKLCLEAGRGIDGLIGHTQPRRIAARSLAARIAEELDSPLGQHVGFKIRFTDVTSDRGYIKLMTDGILLAEMQGDPSPSQYDTII